MKPDWLDEITKSDPAKPSRIETLKDEIAQTIRALKQIDYDIFGIFGDPGPLQRAERLLRDMRAFIEEAEKNALRDFLLQNSEEEVWMPTWKILVESESDPEKEYSVAWGWSPSLRSGNVYAPDYSCTCPDFRYNEGRYCKHIQQIHAEHGSDGEMPPSASITGRCLVVRDEFDPERGEPFPVGHKSPGGGSDE